MENKEELKHLLLKYSKPIFLEKIVYITSQSLIPLFILIFFAVSTYINSDWINGIIKLESPQDNLIVKYLIVGACIFLISCLLIINFFNSISFFKERKNKYTKYLQNEFLLKEWNTTKEIGKDKAYLIFESENYFYFLTTVIGQNIIIIEKKSIMSLQLLFTERRHSTYINRFFNIKITTLNQVENEINLETNRNALGKQEDIDNNPTLKLFSALAKYAKHVEVDYQKPIRFFDNKDLINSWINGISK